MGINLEYMTLLQLLYAEGQLPKGSVIELGDQDISADFQKMASHGKKMSSNAMDKNIKEIKTASELYQTFGFRSHHSIDASGAHGAHIFDLNTDITKNYNFNEKFDLVTNLGTIEHCFNPSQAFQNVHNLCKLGGLMIHAFPSCGNTNHGFYNFQPRLFALMAEANNYQIIKFLFTSDYKPTLRLFSKKHYQTFDDRDLMCYVVFQKTQEKEFVFPFDSMFHDINRLDKYQNTLCKDDFQPYIKGSWNNIKPMNLVFVPRKIIVNPSFVRRAIKTILNLISKYV